MVDNIRKALKELRVPCTITDITEGPHVIAYKLNPGYTPYASSNTPPKRVGVGAIVRSAKDVAIALGVPAYMRYENDSVWLEIAKDKRDLVSHEDVLIPLEYVLPIPLGLDTRGEPVVIDLANPVSPHLLIAGATGSGKSVCINSIIYSLAKRFPPSKLKFLMIDPKRVELSKFKTLEHLVHPIITGTDGVTRALYEMIDKMEDTYTYMEDVGVTDISDTYKPRHIIVVDEYADLVLALDSVPGLIARLAQKGRAAGFHLVLATQRPSVDVIDGVIKGNFPTRIAFSVVTNTDSRVILDMGGAERLTGMGDGLLLKGGGLTRFQGIYVDDDTIRALTGTEKKSITSRPSEVAPNVTVLMDENGRTIGLEYKPPEEQVETGGNPNAGLIAVIAIVCIACLLMAIAGG